MVLIIPLTNFMSSSIRIVFESFKATVLCLGIKVLRLAREASSLIREGAPLTRVICNQILHLLLGLVERLVLWNYV